MEKIMLEQFMLLSKQIGELGARMEEGFKRQDEKIDNVEKNLNEKIVDVKNELNEKIDNVEKNLNEKIDDVKNELNVKIDNVEKELKGSIAENMQSAAEMFTDVFKEIEKVENNY